MDKTVRLFDVATAKQQHAFTVGAELQDMQCGVVWLDASTVAAVSLGGDLNLFDTRTRACRRTVHAHQRNVTAMACSGASFWTADYEGKTFLRNVDTAADAERVPPPHTNAVVAMHASSAKKLVTVGLDDKLVWSSGSDVTRVQLPGAPTALCVSAAGLCVVATVKGVALARKDKGVLSCLALPSLANAAAISTDGCDVVVGCEDGSVHAFAVSSDDTLTPKDPLPARHRGAITCMSYSPDGKLLASADANREVIVWELGMHECRLAARYHTARVTSLAWRPDSARVASGSLDASIIVWDPAEGASKRVTITQAHREGVSCLGWCGNILVSAGADCTVRSWTMA